MFLPPLFFILLAGYLCTRASNLVMHRIAIAPDHRFKLVFTPSLVNILQLDDCMIAIKTFVRYIHFFSFNS